MRHSTASVEIIMDTMLKVALKSKFVIYYIFIEPIYDDLNMEQYDTNKNCFTYKDVTVQPMHQEPKGHILWFHARYQPALMACQLVP